MNKLQRRLKLKIIKHEQGSKEWLQWRRSLLTATDASVVLDKSPYCTPYELWQRKLCLIPEQKSNSAMARGSRLEPEARAWFNEKYQLDMEPSVVESLDYNYLGASLDGMSKCSSFILEIKCNGPRNHGLAKEGHIPDYHLYQMFHQLICTRSEKCFYLSYTEDEKIVIELCLEPEFEKYYIPIAKEFWRKVVYLEPPEHFVLKEKKN